MLIGVPLGLLAGYYRGIWETIIMRAADIFMSFPSMILILVLVAVFGPSIMNVTIVIGVLGWTSMAKLIYGNTLSMREKEYIEAARAMGMKNSKIIFSEILPNAIAPVWVSIAFRVSSGILTESSLSFLALAFRRRRPPGATLSSRRRTCWCSQPVHGSGSHPASASF